MMMSNKIVTARYIDAEIKKYENNPLINTLPKINKPQDVAKLINRRPKITQEEIALPAYLRRHAMAQLMDDFIYPTRAHVQLEESMSTMIRYGYINRNIATSDFQNNLDRVKRTDFKATNAANNNVFSSSIIGCSGSGKTTAIISVLSGYDQAVYHPEYQHTQLVWLKLDSPHDGSPRSLCINFFRAVDEVLGTGYEKLYVKSRSSAETMLGSIARVSTLHSIGLLVIDEIQHLNTAKSGGATKILNFFVTLNNVIKVPVLFVGTPNALELFSPTMRSARRATMAGSIMWNRLERSHDENDKKDWDKFISQMWKLQWFREPTPLTFNLKDLFWDCSQGIISVAVSLFYLCQARAVAVGREFIDEALITKVFNDDLSMIHPMIRALQSGRKSEIDKFSDLEISSSQIIKLVHSGDDVVDDIDDNQDESELSDKLSNLTNMLVQAGISKKVASLTAKQAIADKPEEDLFGLLAHIKALEDKSIPKPKAKKKTEKLTPKFVDNDLRLLITESSIVSYSNLKKSGLILDISKFI
jgi:hypothetical protein